MEAFYRNALEQLEAVEDCLKARRILSALCQLYSLVDVTASLEKRPGEGSSSSFVRWVDENMLPASALRCTALELCAARCGGPAHIHF